VWITAGVPSQGAGSGGFGAQAELANQLWADLLSAFPGVVRLFAEIDSPISLTFLTRFCCAEGAAWLSEKRIAAWLAGVGYCGGRPSSSS
jgi:transposase